MRLAAFKFKGKENVTKEPEKEDEDFPFDLEEASAPAILSQRAEILVPSRLQKEASPAKEKTPKSQRKKQKLSLTPPSDEPEALLNDPMASAQATTEDLCSTGRSDDLSAFSQRKKKKIEKEKARIPGPARDVFVMVQSISR